MTKNYTCLIHITHSGEVSCAESSSIRKVASGKSTIACNLAAVGAARGRRTLLIDLDAQANSSRYLLGQALADARRRRWRTSSTACSA
jgi:gluconate kinase